MPPQYAPNLLRVVTQRLSSTPCQQLPHIAPYLAAIIAQHGTVLATSSKDSQVVGDTESTVIAHKLKTQLSALLQDKNTESRYAAVILIKTTVEVGGWNILQGVGSWVRGLVGILGKPDPPTTKKLCIITLTRVFLLTHEHQSLVREITTPSLPGFIAACLNLIDSPRSPKAASKLQVGNPCLLVVLQALSELIALHPTVFRPFIPQFHSLTYPLIAPTPSNLGSGNDPVSVSTLVFENARRLFVLLHVTGPKNTAAEEWARSLDALIVSTQRTANKVFRSLIEDWAAPNGSYDSADPNQAADVVSDQAPTPLALPAWTGIFAGIERLDGLLHTLQIFLSTTTAAAVKIPVGSILNLVDRLLSISPPGNGRNPRVKPEIGRDEREGLWAGLPRVQTSAIGVCSLMMSRVGRSSAAIACTVLEELLWSYESQYRNDDFRKAAYMLMTQIIYTFGPSLPGKYAVSLSRCIRMCSEDLLPSVESHLQGGQNPSHENKKAVNGITSKNADSYLKAATNHVDLSVISTNLLQAAEEVLLVALTKLPHEFVPFSLRCQIERTAILTKNEKLMLASVMNPLYKGRGQKQISSILPLLAGAFPEALQVEALLRPQIPPVATRRSDGGTTRSDEEGDTDMHDHSQVSESNEFYREFEDTRDNAQCERNIVPEDRSAQSGATLGAAKETSPRIGSADVFNSTFIDLQDPESSSYTSKKRQREEKSDLNTRESIQNDGTAQVEVGVASKRSRVVVDETQKETLPKPVPSNSMIADAGEAGQTVKISALDSTAALDKLPNVQQEYSDESEFEMPILNLDTDSDDEEEEEEEE